MAPNSRYELYHACKQVANQTIPGLDEINCHTNEIRLCNVNKPQFAPKA